jgi:uncharacterized membrane protein
MTVLVSWLSCMISPQHYQASLKHVTHKISSGLHKHMTANQHASSRSLEHPWTWIYFFIRGLHPHLIRIKMGWDAGFIYHP